MMHTARKDQRLFGQLLFCVDRGETLCAKMGLRCVPTLFFESLAPLAKPCSAPANLRQHSSGLAIHGANDRGRAMLAPAT